MGEVVRLIAKRREPRMELDEVLVFLSCHDGEVGVRMPTVEDTPENRAQVGMMFIKAAQALVQPAPGS